MFAEGVVEVPDFKFGLVVLLLELLVAVLQLLEVLLSFGLVVFEHLALLFGLLEGVGHVVKFPLVLILDLLALAFQHFIGAVDLLDLPQGLLVLVLVGLA